MEQSTRNTCDVVNWFTMYITAIPRIQGEAEWGRNSTWTKTENSPKPTQVLGYGFKTLNEAKTAQTPLKHI